MEEEGEEGEEDIIKIRIMVDVSVTSLDVLSSLELVVGPCAVSPAAALGGAKLDQP